jgi:hypothetical protein
MAYTPLQTAADMPQDVRAIITDYVDAVLADVHDMLRHPIPMADLHSGYNISAAIVLLSLVGGVSRVLYDPTRHKKAGKAFKGCLEEFFPWDEEPAHPNVLKGAAAASVLWDEYRNPLEHELALPPDKKTPAQRIAVAKESGMAEDRIESLENLGRRPPLLPTVETHDFGTSIFVGGLYWGIRRMIIGLTYKTDMMRMTLDEFRRRGVPAAWR